MISRRSVVTTLLAALLAPVLLVTMPYTAQADTGYSDWFQTTQTGQSGVSGYFGDNIDCFFGARWRLSNDPTEARAQIRNGECTGPSLSASPGATVTLSGNAVGGGGGACSYATTFDPDDTGSSWSIVEQLEWQADIYPDMGGVVCDIGLWEVCTANGACAFGTIGLGTWQDVAIPNNSANCYVTVAAYWLEVQAYSGGPDGYEIRVGWLVEADVPGTIGGDWGFVIRHANGGFSRWDYQGQTGPGYETWEVGEGFETIYTDWFPHGTEPNSIAPVAIEDAYSVSGAPSMPWNFFDFWNSSTGASYPNTINGQGNDGIAPDPATNDGTDDSCTYWVAEEGQSPSDGPPGGSVGDEGDPAPENPGDPPETVDPDTGSAQGCDFSFTNPSTWAAGGICALVRLAQKMVGWLRTIASAIAALPGKILDGLQALFVPRDDVMEGHVTAMLADYEASSPGQWSGDTGAIFTELGAIGGGGTCEGPTLDVDLGGSGFTMKPLNACTEPMSTVAGVVKLLLALFTTVGGIFWAVHFIGSGLGMHNRLPTWDQGELF